MTKLKQLLTPTEKKKLFREFPEIMDFPVEDLTVAHLRAIGSDLIQSEYGYLAAPVDIPSDAIRILNQREKRL